MYTALRCQYSVRVIGVAATRVGHRPALPLATARWIGAKVVFLAGTLRHNNYCTEPVLHYFIY